MDERAVAQKLEALERKVTVLERKLARRGSGTRWAGGLALVVVAAMPMLAWTYARPHPAFEPGTPISAAQVNDTIDDVYAALNTLDAESARVQASTVVDAMGALPASGAFDSEGGTVILWVSGSGWRLDAAGFVGVDVLVDGESIGLVRAYTNEPTSHKAFVATPFVLPRLAAGSHSVELQALTGTASDLNDPYSVVALELPR